MDDFQTINLTTEVQQLITADQAWFYSIIPHSDLNGVFKLYVDEEKLTNSLINELEILFGKQVELISVSRSVLENTLFRLYRKDKKIERQNKAGSFLKMSDDFMAQLIEEANGIASSDVHIEIYEEKCRVRMRIDGKLVERYILNHADYPALINKIKIKANLDIAEKRLPQDGRIYYSSGKNSFDIRVSVLPTLYGEKIVLRLLSKDATNIDIQALGFSEKQLNQYLESIRKPHGVVLISGPTGSGKTTTLYATLKVLNDVTTNILTIEDPIEYTLDGINQVQLKESIGLTFASALRTFLRQDPDILMLGEIRDAETAQMAIRAALTGHLVLSTIHTNSAWGTITRLLDMGIPSFLLANTINLTAAQRLVRILCQHCKQKVSFDEGLFPSRIVKPVKLQYHYVARGCEKCYFTGYKGRKAIYEIIPIDVQLSEKIRNKVTDESQALLGLDFSNLSESAWLLLERGETSIDEVYSILMNSI
jgi:general secretion pathway protein E/type IV pilus assembly protein PilB